MKYARLNNMPRTVSNQAAVVTVALLLSVFGQTAFAQESATDEPVPTARVTVRQAALNATALSASALARIEEIVREGIAESKMPGCVIRIEYRGKTVLNAAYGQRKVDAESAANSEPMTVDTIFDLASLTKPIATATCIMQLIERGDLELNTSITTQFPEFGKHGKEKIRVVDLLVHQSGLIPDNPLGDYLDGPDMAWERICNLELIAPVGTQFKYSDVNFIVLAKLIEKLSGQNVHEYSKTHLFAPLAMSETGFQLPAALRHRAAPTERRDGEWIQGVVHDPRAYQLDGIAGHAGLFSTAGDLAVYAQMMLGHGTLPSAEGNKPAQIIAPETFDMMTQRWRVSNGFRGLGWDKQSPYSSNRGSLLTESAFGHGGFTGTVIWIDPELDLSFIFLSNRLHPNGSGSVNRLAAAVADVAVESLLAE